MSYKFYFFACAFILFYYVPNSHQNISDLRKNHVSIQRGYDGTNPNSGEHFCSGAIIDDIHVLSSSGCFGIQIAGQLVAPIQPIISRVVVVVGISEIYGSGIIRRVRKVFVHRLQEESYGTGAILQLMDNMDLETNRDRLHAFPLDRGNAFYLYENEDALVPGSGCRTVFRVIEGVLHPLPNPAEMREFLLVRMLRRYQTTRYNQFIEARVHEGPQLRACVDYGSPLVYRNMIIGIYIRTFVHYDEMVFARVSRFIDFIDHARAENGDHNDMHILTH